jgi:predicted anti-sigma-YlaC factor YlaD
MSKHVTEWLNAYLDGELRGNRLLRVEIHLVECEACQAELESLDRISNLLHEASAPAFILPERLAARVRLRLPARQGSLHSRRILEVGWWMIPVGLLGLWIFSNTSFFMGDILSTAANLGLLAGASGWLEIGSSSQAYWTASLGQIGVLSGNGFNWAASTEAFARSSLSQFMVQISIALLYLSWLAIWWARHWRHQLQQHLQLLEG